MLVLSRKRRGEIHVNLSGLISLINDGRQGELIAAMKQPIVVSVVDIRGDKARLGFEAHKLIAVDREEIAIRKREEGAA